MSRSVHYWGAGQVHKIRSQCCIVNLIAFLLAIFQVVAVDAQNTPFHGLDHDKILQRDPLPKSDIQAFVKDLSKNDAAFEVIVGQGRLLALQDDLVKPGQTSPLIAVGDPTVIDFQSVDTRHLRITGQRIGVTDLSIILSNGKSYNFEVSVVIDLKLLEAQLRMSFPDAQLRLAQHREHLIVDGQARSTRQVAQILSLIQAFLDSAQSARSVTGQTGLLTPTGPAEGGAEPTPDVPPEGDGENPEGEGGLPVQLAGGSNRPNITATLNRSQIINLIRVPGPQQVMLKVQVAELNRTALRRLGTSWLLQNTSNAGGVVLGPSLPQMSGGNTGGVGSGGMDEITTALSNTLLGLLDPVSQGQASAVFGVFDGGRTTILIDALRQNQVMRILAEPTLVSLHGQEASFIAGGRFPVPVPQPGGGQSLVTIEYREFGVSLNFVPFILDDETIRMAVAPKVSSIDFSTGVVIQGTSVPGEQTREAQTTVEMLQGQTLAIAGLLQVDSNSSTNRIPGLGDIPVIGTMFSNNSTQRNEKELIVLVTPYLVEAMRADQVPPLPGDDVLEPNDKEFYLDQRIEGRGHEYYRSTEAWDDPLGIKRVRRGDRAGRVFLQ